MKNFYFKKNSIFLLLCVAVLLFNFSLLSCAPDLDFGEIVTCEKLDKETYAPVIPKDSFDIGAQQIFATIKAAGIKSEDKFSFVWKNKETGKIIFENTDKYSAEKKGYIEGYIASSIYLDEEDKEKGNILAEPGEYIVEFFHNSTLTDTAEFKILIPDVKILEVLLTDEVSDNYEPLNSKNQFGVFDIFYACVKLNYQIEGNTIGAKLFSNDSDLLQENQFETVENYYKQSYTAFKFLSDIPWKSGNYSVEVYLNSILCQKHDFKVAVPVIELSNIYSDEQIEFSIKYPQDCEISDSKDEAGLAVDFLLFSGSEPLVLTLWVINENYYPGEEEFLEYADEISNNINSTNNWKQTDIGHKDYELNSVSVKEFSYEYLDDENKYWKMNLSFIIDNNRLYLFEGLSNSEYAEILEVIYYGMLDTLSFK